MRVAVTSTGPDLNAQVDPRFGRCACFLFIDPDTMEFEAVENPNVSAMGGAGIQSAQLVANKGAEVILTGSCGPNAFQTFQAAGVKVIVGVTGLVSDAIRRFKSGELQPTPQPNVSSHFGMGYGQPMGPGFGMGGGMGRGMGRGMGGGMGRGMGGGMGPGVGYGPMPQAPGMQQPPGMGPTPPGAPQATPEQELHMLKQQADLLRQQMDAIDKRIKELESKKSPPD